MNDNLKKCTLCNQCWADINKLLEDKTLTFDGYMALPKMPSEGVFLFTHNKDDCGTTFAIKAKNFTPLITDGEIELLPFTPGEATDCKGHCLNDENLHECHSKTCNGRIIRDLVHKVKIKLEK